jgi:hypothetical protein
MELLMDSVLSKVTSYRIFNHLLPGAIFCIFCDKFIGWPILSLQLFEALIIYYLAGVSLSRLGSLALEPILKRLGVVSYSEYSNFVKANRTDPKIDVLLEESNMYRTLCMAFICISVLTTIKKISPSLLIPTLAHYITFSIALFFILILSYRKQSDYISQRVDSLASQDDQ